MRITASGVLRIEYVNKKIKKKWIREAVIQMAKDLVTCKYCGITERGHICPHRKSRVKKGDRKSDKFRNTKVWQLKREEIKQRDRHLCAVCLANLYNTINWLNYKNVEVHHIEKLEENYSRRLDNSNLISLCSYHHKMAENGEIPREVLYELVAKVHKE